MRKPLTKLPSLDLIRGFEAAARNLSFTRAAEELFVTQSAVSRQIKALEDHLGTPLFRRRHRALLLTDAGQILYRASSEIMRELNEATARLAAEGAGRMLTVTCTVSFASLWLVPRLPEFRRQHLDIDVRISANNEVFDLEREGVDVAVRYCEPKAAPAGATRLFGEEVFPVCSKALARDRARPLKSPEDLRHHVLLHLDDPRCRWPWLNWREWLEAMNVPDLEPAGVLRFSHYDQMIQAAMDGEGVALGRHPLLGNLIRRGRLVAPFDRKSVSSRAYYVIVSRAQAERDEVKRFVAWLKREGRRERGSEERQEPARTSGAG